jgi:hypothetical protein
MYETQRDEFETLIRDLCTSTDRPCGADLLRVFWHDLKDVPLQAIQRQAAILRTKGVKRFSSNDLRPPAEEASGPIIGYDNTAIVDRLSQYMLRRLWSKLSPLQRLYKHAWVYTRDRAAPRCIALKIEADREEKMIDGELRVIEYPGYYIRHEDCDNDSFAPTREDLPLHSRENFDEAAAATELLNRKI